jgi:hypothetical protein
MPHNMSSPGSTHQKNQRHTFPTVYMRVLPYFPFSTRSGREIHDLGLTRGLLYRLIHHGNYLFTPFLARVLHYSPKQPLSGFLERPTERADNRSIRSMLKRTVRRERACISRDLTSSLLDALYTTSKIRVFRVTACTGGWIRHLPVAP